MPESRRKMNGAGKIQPQWLEAGHGKRAFCVFMNRGDTADRDMSFVLQVNEPGSRSEEDRHDLEQWFFVHRGRVRFNVAGEESTADPGDLVRIPRRAVHWHRPLGNTPAEMLVINHWPEDSEDGMGWDYAQDEPSLQS